MKTALGVAVVAVALVLIFFLFSIPQNVSVSPPMGINTSPNATSAITTATTSSPNSIQNEPEAAQPTSSDFNDGSLQNANDIGPQPPLANPPAIMKGIYITAWVAGSPQRMQSLIALMKSTGLNTVVIE